jgi:hypothetical protein
MLIYVIFFSTYEQVATRKQCLQFHEATATIDDIDTSIRCMCSVCHVVLIRSQDRSEIRPSAVSIRYGISGKS